VPPGFGGACVPFRTAAEAIVGGIFVAVRSPRELSPDEIHLLSTVADIAGNAIQRSRLHEQTERRLQRLTALHAVETAVSASLDLQVTLNVLLDHVTTQLGVDAADVLLLSPITQTLEYSAGRGFRTAGAQAVRLRLGEGYAGQAALDRRPTYVTEMRSRQTDTLRSPLYAAEGFVAMIAVPLLAKGRVVGVLEIFHRSPLAPDPEWQEFLETLAQQAAIAIDGAELFANLQRSNVELSLAYDTTLEGWAHALELRDAETEGHTRRVVELAERLGRAMGLSEAELAQLRRGALLHDIGKVGIPDSILLKPGPLTPEEWDVMRMHPVYAYDLLAPIAYLRTALDVPYCHHERWDGSGYPRGLRGEAIPLTARIFAVVDTWDALLTDRPYRPAWSKERVLDYVQVQAGSQLDPAVVQAFLGMQGLGR
jgi:GAF domain-containing protein